MTTNTAQIEGMEKELLEYYHKNEDRFNKYSHDIDLLKAKLFEGMINDGCFPKRQPKVRHDLTTEYKCTLWLSRAAGEQLTFKDFRKMFKSRLKKCELWSEEFYDVCKDIIGNRQNFLDCRELFKQKNDGIRVENSCQSTLIHATGEKPINTSLYREPINIDKDVITKAIGIRDIQFLNINGKFRMFMDSDELKKICVSWFSKRIERECNFDDFCDYFSVELSLYDKWSQKWNLVCQKICEEDVYGNYTLEEINSKDLHDDYIGTLGLFIWIAVSYILNPIIYSVFCYAIFIIESFLDILTVPIGTMINLPNGGFILLHDYITNDKQVFWNWFVCLTSGPLLISIINDYIKYIKTIIKINTK